MAMIPYGGDQFRVSVRLIIPGKFFLSRIEPENNVDMILSAVSELAHNVFITGIEISPYSRRLYSDFGQKLTFACLNIMLEHFQKSENNVIITCMGIVQGERTLA